MASRDTDCITTPIKALTIIVHALQTHRHHDGPNYTAMIIANQSATTMYTHATHSWKRLMIQRRSIEATRQECSKCWHVQLDAKPGDVSVSAHRSFFPTHIFSELFAPTATHCASPSPTTPSFKYNCSRTRRAVTKSSLAATITVNHHVEGIIRDSKAISCHNFAVPP